MNYSIEMNEIIEERNQLCICLARIAKEGDIKNKEKLELAGDVSGQTFAALCAILVGTLIK